MKKAKTKSRSKTKSKPRRQSRPAKAKAKAKVEAQPVPKVEEARSPGSMTAGKKAESSSALYLYGITRGSAQLDTSACPGIDGGFKVRSYKVDEFSCWISEVDRQQFVTNLEREMENLEWLATAGIRHQTTVEKLAAQT